MARTRIKFCGLVRPADIDAAVALGVDAVGFVFYERSPRALSLDEAGPLRRRLPSWVSAVGLFVNMSADRVRAARARLGLDVIQFHGDESPADCRAAADGAPWWRAVRMRGPGDLLESAVSFSDAEALLVDSFHTGYGGSGRVFDWSWIPEQRARPLILSGGLDASSVGQAITAVGPDAVDVSSGIQAGDPRTKDPRKMEAFIAEVLRVDALRAQPLTDGDRADRSPTTSQP
jgi:phosphoribosylanthranilate isomerase